LDPKTLTGSLMNKSLIFKDKEKTKKLQCLVLFFYALRGVRKITQNPKDLHANSLTPVS